jgi:hypothetical protein
MDKCATDHDHRIIDAVSYALGGSIGRADDVERLMGELKSDDHAKTACEIAVAFIRWSQDLKAARQQSAELAALRERLSKVERLLADDDFSLEVARKCFDPCHDDRYCSTCSARDDGIDAYRAAIAAALAQQPAPTAEEQE